MINNSQGYSAWLADALHVQNMNPNPGRKVPCIRDGWFICDSVQVPQSMVFPPDHTTLPNQLKWVKVILQECGLWHPGMLLICWNCKCEPTGTSCCTTQICQPDFLAQESIIQETIEMARHLILRPIC